MIDDYGIEVEVRGEITDGYRLKVSVTSIGMYVDGFRAVKSDKNRTGYWVQSPAQKVNGKWIHTPEFSTKTDFWAQLDQSCLDAITDYETDVPSRGKDTVITDISDEPINLDDIPDFGS